MKNNRKNMPANRNEWFSADGGWGTPWENASGDNWASADAWRGADAGGATQAHGSAPYIIQIVNACSSAISNVDVGDSYTNRTTSNFGQNSNITITSTVVGVSYLEYLAQSESQPFTVGATMVISTSSGQLDQTVVITHRNASGDRLDHVLTPTLDPYQQQTDRIVDYYEYLMDGFTRLRWNQINGSATVTLRQYLKGKFAASQIVAGRPALQTYGNPNIIKAIPIVAPNRSLGA